MNPILQESLMKIHHKLSQLSPISLDEFQLIAPIVKIEELCAGELFIRPGESSQKLGIILKGLAKTFYIFDNGKEHISHFAYEGSFLGVYTDMLKDIPSTGYVEAIEPCTLIVMNYKEMLEVTRKNLAWAHILRKIAEDRFVYRSEKDRNINLKSAEEKYEYFKKNHGDIIDRLPQNQIALYLNINPATLSRLKNSSGNYKK